MIDVPPARASRLNALTGFTRPRFCGLIAATLGAVLGLGSVKDVAACRKKSARCDRSSQCCSDRCRRGFCYPREKKKKKKKNR